ncbi:MAG TPA: DUF3306 domain-containing protein [Casimicrobiaceae bacterium]|jgi:hypothetical protein
MSEDEKSREPLTLKRWSARKLAATRETTVVQPADAVPPIPQSSATQTDPNPPPTPAPLPPIESLTFDSDFAAFLKPDVDEALKRIALKKLLHDPRFNVMDGLDVYIDDYSKPDPIDPDVVKQLVQARFLFNPPKTRITEEGFVEDVPPEIEKPPAVASSEDSNQIAAESAAASDVGGHELPPAGPQETSALKSDAIKSDAGQLK